MNHKCRAHHKPVTFICCHDTCSNKYLCLECSNSHKKYIASHSNYLMKVGELSNVICESKASALDSLLQKSNSEISKLHSIYLNNLNEMEKIIQTKKMEINNFFDKNFYNMHEDAKMNPNYIESIQKEINQLKRTITLSDVEELSPKYLQYLKLQSSLQICLEKISQGPNEILSEIEGIKKTVGNIFIQLNYQMNSHLHNSSTQMDYLIDLMKKDKSSKTDKTSTKKILDKFISAKVDSQEMIGNHMKCWGWKSFKILENSELLVDAKLPQQNETQNEISIQVISLRDLEVKDEIKVRESFTQDTIILEYLPSTQEFGLTQFTDRIQRIWFFRYSPDANKKLEATHKMFVGKGYIWDFCEFPEKKIMLVGTRGNDVSVFHLFEKTPLKHLSINRMDFFKPISAEYCMIGDKKKINLFYERYLFCI